MVEEKTMDVTPDKSLMMKMGQKNYKIEQALAELADNSIDERVKGQVLNVNIDFTVTPNDALNSYIVVEDNAPGMDEETFKKSAILGSSSKQDKLGLYGLGLKSACMNLAHDYEVITTKVGEDNEYTFEFSEDKWVEDDSLTWNNYPYSIQMINEATHGTKITLTNHLS